MNETKRVSEWLRALDESAEGVQDGLLSVYGNPSILPGRIRLLRAVLLSYLERFGDDAIRVFRSPGRINLRGMHVDTHGGYLNLMTHQRETVAAVSSVDDAVTLANTDASAAEVSFPLSEAGSFQSSGAGWENYVRGTIVEAMEHCRDRPRGLRGVVGNDIPRGASLSSSAALCTALYLAACGVNGLAPNPIETMLAVQQGEWFAGARVGLSDQGAMLLSQASALTNIAIDPAAPSGDGAWHVSWPDDLAVLVVNSYTQRNLSGRERADYARNRFAYSFAMEALRVIMDDRGYDRRFIDNTRTLADVSSQRFEPWGGEEAILRLIQGLPREEHLDTLLGYEKGNPRETYHHYFGDLPEEDRPVRFNLQGPLLFGVAETERARVFPKLIESGAYRDAGRLMCIGHDGDRRVTPDGAPFEPSVASTLRHCPGRYGASSPVLDLLVDAAMRSGALGACLTGAGIAGAVLAVCHRDEMAGVAKGLRDVLASDDYLYRSGRDQPLTSGELSEAVVENVATAPAGEITI